ncbi:META domain-containing protein [Gilliamella sp. W8128]|uniref:META domain-containing protein n=1 Tax=Gilliamella sp. W8128 TaxID=2751010 RepID=UPI0018DE503F|nr:META domain-containing protein [Gilliamella sp. W8128]MBI0153967.1 META domain-containing protein [Gilliamella sp. W8128]
MKKSLLLLLSASLIFNSTGCAFSNSINEQDLMHHHYILMENNGLSLPIFKNVDLEFGENMIMIGKICSEFLAQVKLENNMIKVQIINMTNNKCLNKQLDLLDNVIKKLIIDGANIQLIDTKLVLKNNQDTLIFQLKDYM